MIKVTFKDKNLNEDPDIQAYVKTIEKILNGKVNRAWREMVIYGTCITDQELNIIPWSEYENIYGRSPSEME